jgi:hypothetical protein
MLTGYERLQRARMDQREAYLMGVFIIYKEVMLLSENAGNPRRGILQYTIDRNMDNSTPSSGNMEPEWRTPTSLMERIQPPVIRQTRQRDKLHIRLAFMIVQLTGMTLPIPRRYRRWIGLCDSRRHSPWIGPRTARGRLALL